MKNSNRKGREYELKIAKYLSKIFGVDCKRTPRSGGMDFKGDLFSFAPILKRFNKECKKRERLNIWEALEQSEEDAGSTVPIVIFAKNFSDDYVAMRLKDWCDLLLEILELQEEVKK